MSLSNKLVYASGIQGLKEYGITEVRSEQVQRKVVCHRKHDVYEKLNSFVSIKDSEIRFHLVPVGLPGSYPQLENNISFNSINRN